MKENKDNALIIFAKAPRFGRVKTRLQPGLTPEDSLSLYRAMVEDLLKQLRHTAFCDVKIFYYPSNAKNEVKSWLGDQFEYFPQRGEDLGEKMYEAIAEISRRNYKKVVLIGSDIPTIDTTTIVRAFSTLDSYDVVLGPSQDGGYYLIGLKKAYPRLFETIAWSTNIVLDQTIMKARQLNLDVVQLEIKSDIDTYDDVVELWKLLIKRNQHGKYSYKENTYAVLKGIFDQEFIPAYRNVS